MYGLLKRFWLAAGVTLVAIVFVIFAATHVASQANLGVLLSEGDGSPENTYVYKMVMPNGSLAIADGVATFTAAGTGDVTGVGDCASGDCLDGTSDGGSYIRIYDGDSHYGEIQVPDIAGNVVYTFPSTTSTIASTANITATKIDDLTAADDNTDLNVSTSAHGLAPKLSNNAATWLDGTGAYSAPSAAEVGAATTSTKLDDFASPDDNTDLNASTSAHGLLPKLDDDETHFLNGDGSWAAEADPSVDTDDEIIAIINASPSTQIGVLAGGTGAASLTDGGILLGSGTSAITALGVASNGQIPIGDGTTDPVLANITVGSGDAITVANGAGSIALSLHASLESIGDLTETSGGIPYGTADNTYAWLPASGTSGALLQSNGAGFSPSWTTSFNLAFAGATPGILIQDTTEDAAGTATISADAYTATYDSVLQLRVDDSAGEDTVYLELDGTAEDVEINKDVSISADNFLQASSTTLSPSFTLRNTTDDATGPVVVFGNLRAGDANNEASDNFVLFKVRGYDTAAISQTFMAVDAAADWGDSATDTPTQIRFLTVPDGSETPTLALTIGSDQSATFTGAVINSGTQFKLPSSNADPTATAGYLRHDSTISNFTNGGLVYHNGAAIKQLVDMTTATASACTDDQVVAYDADADLWYCKDDTSAGAPTWDSISDPEADKAFTFQDNEITSFSFADTNEDMLTVTGVGAFGDVSVMKVAQDTGDPTDGTVLEVTAADANVDPLVVSSSGQAGALVVGQNAGVVTVAAGLTVSGGTVNLSGASTTLGTVTGAVDAGGATSVEIPNSDDPDVDAAGEISWDTDGWMRAYDGSAQVAIARKLECHDGTVVTPNDLADGTRDAFRFWQNNSGMSFIVTSWTGQSDTDNTTLNIEETDNDGANNATVDAVEIAGDGTNLYYATDGTITAGTIETGHIIWLDFDDTDDPGWVSISICGYYNADVN